MRTEGGMWVSVFVSVYLCILVCVYCVCLCFSVSKRGKGRRGRYLVPCECVGVFMLSVCAY